MLTRHFEIPAGLGRASWLRSLFDNEPSYYRSKINYTISWDKKHISRDQTLVAWDKSLVSWEEIKTVGTAKPFYCSSQEKSKSVAWSNTISVRAHTRNNFSDVWHGKRVFFCLKWSEWLYFLGVLVLFVKEIGKILNIKLATNDRTDLRNILNRKPETTLAKLAQLCWLETAIEFSLPLRVFLETRK